MILFNIDPSKVDPKKFRRYFWRFLVLEVVLVVVVFWLCTLGGCARTTTLHVRGAQIDSLSYQHEVVIRNK